MKKTIQQPHVIAAGIWIFVVAFLGGLLTEIGPWYYSLKQPDWKPPDWAFGLIWTTIFILSGVAWSKAWKCALSRIDRVLLASLFLLNGILNLFWSFLYFKLHRPDWALLEAFFLWLSVAAIMLVMRRYDRPATLLMAPYLVWVSLAILLNWETIRLNGLFVN